MLQQDQQEVLCALVPPEQLDVHALCARIFGERGGCDKRGGGACNAAAAALQPFTDAACVLGADTADGCMALADVLGCSILACGGNVLEVRMRHAHMRPQERMQMFMRQCS